MTHLSILSVQQPNHNVRYWWRHLSAVNSQLQLIVQCHAVKTLAVHCHSDVCSVAGGLTARCRTSRVCLQHYAMWWHLMVLQYVTVSFHLPSVSSANTNTVQYTKPHQNHAILTIHSVVISKVLLPQSNFKAAFVRSNSSLLCDGCTELPTNIMAHILQLYSVWSFPAHLLRHLHIMSKYHNTLHFILLVPTDPIFCKLRIFGGKKARI